VLPEECQVNPDTYGAELAWWLCTRLYTERGIVTSYPNQEDWVWFLDYSTEDGAEFALHCVNVAGTTDRWLVSLRRFGRKMFGRDKPEFALADDLVRAVRELLEAEGSVTELEWRFDEAGS
jgi:hypothetical protein